MTLVARAISRRKQTSPAIRASIAAMNNPAIVLGSSTCNSAPTKSAAMTRQISRSQTVHSMMASSVDTFVELGDGNAPEFHHAEGPTRKMFADNPDADYMRSPISTGAGQVYRVWGRVPPGTTYTGVLLYGRGGRVGNRLTDGELGLDQDGNFELRISKARQDGVWLQADGDETAVFVRQYYTDRKLQAPVELSIELLGDHGAPPPLTAEVLTVGVERARRMMRVVWERTLGAWRMASTAALNQFIEIPGEGLFPLPFVGRD